MILIKILLFSLLYSSLTIEVLAADICKVLLIDLEKEKKEEKGSSILIGEFNPIIGEDLETTRYFVLPGGKKFVTVTLIYTDGGVWVKDKDNSLLADSIIIGLAVTKRKEKSAFLVDGVAQLSPYRDSTTLIQLGRTVEINKRRFVLEVECWCNDSKPWDEADTAK